MNRRANGKGTSRKGYVLVLVAMLLWAILGLAALVIDLGLARVKLRQMQSATDTAALEALRDGYAAAIPEDSLLTDNAKRLFAQTLQYQSIDGEETSSRYLSNDIEFETLEDGGMTGPKIVDPRLAPNEYPMRTFPSFKSASPGTSEQNITVTYHQQNLTGADPGLVWLFGRGPLLKNEGTAYLVPQGITFSAASQTQLAPAMTFGRIVSIRDDLENVVRVIDGVTLVCDAKDWVAGVDITSNLKQLKAPKPGSQAAFLTFGGLFNQNDVDTSSNNDTGYVAIFTEADDGLDRFVGFGKVENGFVITSSDDNHFRHEKLILKENVSASWNPALSNLSLKAISNLLVARGKVAPNSLIMAPILTPTPLATSITK
ncbi:hypothetical protein DTL42_04815 [Bremerella cremea]|uniref:Putative Flp pilus-assembly TadG-like N-terminal domain-containing protein n=1 Tax=Bremerella cremea TaxID=1031537 RepID=A0A368KXU2_9BACT|nr:Tad domain-containing protein [Bremerella cremea]RCS54467.1 hypothetical protein DTL42_04815 [Bremerella cremea]